MKQNSIKIIKHRLSALKIKKNVLYYYTLKSLIKNSSNISFKLNYFLKNINFYFDSKKKNKKICNLNGKYNSVNKKLKFTRTSLNLFLIENSLFFYKK